MLFIGFARINNKSKENKINEDLEEKIEDSISLTGNVDIEDINSILSKKYYNNFEDSNSISFYLIIIKEHGIKIQRHISNISNSLPTKISIPYNCDFILSFHMNSTIPYDWNLFSSQNNECVNIKDISKIRCPIEKKEEGIEGKSNYRENFYFQNLKKGKQLITFKYLPDSQSVVKTMMKELNIEVSIH